MSIIYDALNKPDKGGDNENKNNEKQNDTVKPQNKGKNAAIVILAFLVICGSLYFLGKKYINRADVADIMKKMNIAAGPQAKKTSPARGSRSGERTIVVPEKTYAPNKYVLEGIIYDSDGTTPLAIINGKVLKEKERIDSYEVVKIETSRVELINREDNTPKTLSF